MRSLSVDTYAFTAVKSDFSNMEKYFHGVANARQCGGSRNKRMHDLSRRYLSLARKDKISDTIIPKLYLIIKCFAEKRLQKSFYA